MVRSYPANGGNGTFLDDAVNTYYEDHGDAQSYPLVLIHPIGGNILIWHHEIPLLLKSGFRVIAYEIRGHYRTGMGKVGAYAMQDLVTEGADYRLDGSTVHSDGDDDGADGGAGDDLDVWS